MTRLGIDLGLSFPALDPRCLDRLGLLAGEFTLPYELFNHSMGPDLGPAFLLPFGHHLFGILNAVAQQQEQSGEKEMVLTSDENY